MSKVICIAGESGSGKTTSMRNLDPKTTFYIDADCKGLSWKGWRNQYNTENKNYKATDDAYIVRQFIKKIAESCPSIKVIVVDTINGLMVADEMRRSKEKGYDKWVDLAACVWDLVCECYTYRDDLTIVFTAHTQTDHDEKEFFPLWNMVLYDSFHFMESVNVFRRKLCSFYSSQFVSNKFTTFL